MCTTWCNFLRYKLLLTREQSKKLRVFLNICSPYIKRCSSAVCQTRKEEWEKIEMRNISLWRLMTMSPCLSLFWNRYYDLRVNLIVSNRVSYKVKLSQLRHILIDGKFPPEVCIIMSWQRGVCSGQIQFSGLARANAKFEHTHTDRTHSRTKQRENSLFSSRGGSAAESSLPPPAAYLISLISR